MVLAVLPAARQWRTTCDSTVSSISGQLHSRRSKLSKSISVLVSLALSSVLALRSSVLSSKLIKEEVEVMHASGTRHNYNVFSVLNMEAYQ